MKILLRVMIITMFLTSLFGMNSWAETQREQIEALKKQIEEIQRQNQKQIEELRKQSQEQIEGLQRKVEELEAGRKEPEQKKIEDLATTKKNQEKEASWKNFISIRFNPDF